VTTYEYHNAGNTEAQQKEALTFMLSQVSVGKAATGVLTGLTVAQTTTASGSVTIAAGAGVAQAATLDGASLLVNDSQLTLDIFTANPMGGLPRNDVVVFDAATVTIRAITGAASATPTDPTIPTSAIPLARLRHAASATTIPASKIDSLISATSLFGGPSPRVSTAKAGKRIHWDSANTGALDANGYATITHGAGFTPTSVVITSQTLALQFLADTFTATTFRARVINSDGTAGVNAQTFSYFCGE